MDSRLRPADCKGPSRRALLRAGLYGASALSLGDLLHLRALSVATEVEAAQETRNCILVWLAGGASHIDTFDPKPEASTTIRGEFKPIDTAVEGLKISEVFPSLSKVMDRVTLIRALSSPEADHDRAAHHLLTGYRPSPALVYPSFGSVVGKFQEAKPGLLPPYVAIPDAPLFSSSGYLTPAYDPFAVMDDPNQAGFRVRNLTPPDRRTLERLQRRRAMVERLNTFSRDVPSTPLTASRDRFAEQAYSLLTSTSAQAAFRLDEEPEAMRQRYGRTRFGQSCLLARRLIEAGVSFVTLNDRGMGALGWDTHQQNFASIRETLAPPVDQGLSVLIQDLDERGLLESTLVVMMGEFGRTPRINKDAGRDHHGRANCALLAGAGLPKGIVVGQTDPEGEAPADRPTSPADLAALIYTRLGISPDLQFETPDGRPLRLVEDGKVPAELA